MLWHDLDMRAEYKHISANLNEETHKALKEMIDLSYS